MRDQPTVVVVSGHMVDAPGRPRARFPQEAVPRVTAAVRDALEDWGVGPGTTLVTGGARGADIIAAEEARARGASIRLVLALRPNAFERASVALPGTDWAARYRALVGVADVEIIERPTGQDAFARANARIIAIARELDPAPHALIVWDGAEGDGPGGTRDFVARLGLTEHDERVRMIDPTPLAGRHPPGPEHPRARPGAVVPRDPAR